ncbi:High-affinity branched-chain amino acid transport ATP-binding protein LivF [subsurface metagenome]|nr:ATP-binding cassette domain-containing protein [Clostridia bacterium]
MLKINNLVVYYGAVQVIFDVFMEVKKGELIALIGPNGAGKTTILNVISGVHKLTNGRIEYKNQNISNLEPHIILSKGIAHCPEGRQLWPGLTVRENLEVGSFIRRDQKIKEDLERVFEYFPILKDRQKQLARTLSGGEAQMLAIARTLMARPEFILFDEPSLGLAPTIVGKLEEIIRTIREEEQMTILLVEQNARLALDLSDRAYVLETGSVVVEGPSEELLQRRDVYDVYLGIS